MIFGVEDGEKFIVELVKKVIENMFKEINKDDFVDLIVSFFVIGIIVKDSIVVYVDIKFKFLVDDIKDYFIKYLKDSLKMVDDVGL